ncbi:MAG: YfiR family protein [Spongiibacteraceae bacterium]
MRSFEKIARNGSFLKDRMRVASILFSLLALVLASRTHAEEISREYRIKAAYLYNLGKFIIWPNENEMPKDAPITICIYGYNPFDRYLDKLQERQIRGKPISVRYLGENDAIDSCQLLFISQLNTSRPKLLSAPPPYPPILTISDDQDFLNHGGHVSLVAANNNVQLDIDLTRAKQTGFNVSASLLEIAHRIQ